jgi:hypothetical protein
LVFLGLLEDSGHRVIERWIVGRDMIGVEIALDQSEAVVVAIFHSPIERLHFDIVGAIGIGAKGDGGN